MFLSRTILSASGVIGPLTALGNDLGFDSGYTGFGPLLLIGSRNQYVTVCFQDLSFVGLCLGETQNPSVLQSEVF